MEIKTLDIDSLLMLSKFSESSPITSVWRRSKMLLGKHNPSLLKVVPEQREVSQSCWHLVSRIPVNPPGSVPEGLLPLGFTPGPIQEVLLQTPGPPPQQPLDNPLSFEAQFGPPSMWTVLPSSLPEWNRALPPAQTYLHHNNGNTVFCFLILLTVTLSLFTHLFPILDLMFHSFMCPRSLKYCRSTINVSWMHLRLTCCHFSVVTASCSNLVQPPLDPGPTELNPNLAIVQLATECVQPCRDVVCWPGCPQPWLHFRIIWGGF